MTLRPYDPEKLDALALRLLDLASVFRSMANRSRHEDLGECSLHEKKALEWLANLENWTDKVLQDFELSVIRNRGAKRAREGMQQ